MKALLFIFSLFTSIFLWGKQFDGYYINNANDTIECKIEAPVGSLLNKIKTANIQKKITIIDKNGTKSEFKPSEIKGFFINDYDGLHFKSLKINDKKSMFVQVVTEGSINLYKYDNGSEFKSFGGASGVVSTRDAVPYIVQMDNKDYFFCKSLKKFLEYSEDEYFNERYDASYGNWGYLLESFAIDYNNLKEHKK